MPGRRGRREHGEEESKKSRRDSSDNNDEVYIVMECDPPRYNALLSDPDVDYVIEVP